ncbi:HAD family hydrolase [Oceanivirga miroungae]|uniref:Cof family hydrolase n=1 Tax=Oceanivirga miroungae TaxID=1130046 RepID=A0A6I8M4H4_9FUSO|nr:HAD family hydrolase [Oceanivirga miroungae]VWL84804.1 cof family hydrolase [Oceanivirga miroungae]
MYKAVVTDLDGTLLDKDHFLSEYTKEMMQKFLEKGYKLYIATGRNEKGARFVADKISKNIPIITTNGARVLDENNEELFSIFLDKKTNDILTSVDYRSFGEEIFINGYEADNWYVVDDSKLDEYFKRRIDKKYYPDLISEKEFKSKRYNKIYFVGEFENLKKLRTYLEERISDTANIAFVSKRSLEVYDKSATKLNAAKYLLKRDNIKESEVISFGDGLNDYEMLNGFEKSFVMDNALVELKEKLPNKEVIENSHTDSVARKVKEVFNL